MDGILDHMNGARLDPGVPEPGRLKASSGNGTMTEGLVSSQTQLVLEVLMVLMCLCAVTGNVLVIVTVAATKTFHSVTSVLIINLAISDLLVGIGVMPFLAVSVMNSSWVDCTDLCLYVGYTSSVYCTASVLTLAAIALDRYHSIMYCLRYSSRCTLWRTCTVVLWIWLQALVSSCPPLLGWCSISYVGPMYSCVVNWASSPSYTAFMAALSYLIPGVVILFCYVNIVKVARSHARTIHTLEDNLLRGRRTVTSDLSSLSHPNLQQCSDHSSPSALVYHLSGQFVSEVHGEESTADPQLSDSATPQPSSNPTSRRLFSFLAQSSSPPSRPQQITHHHHHGVVRLFLVILAFFLCWTPYMGVALVQATETALSGTTSLIPPTAVTFSYWLLLLNSDINPLLYALLSKRYQGALHSLKQKVSTPLGNVMGRGREVGTDGDEGRCSDPYTVTTQQPSLCSTSESSTSNEANYSSPIFTVDTRFQQHSSEHLCEVFLPGSSSPPSCSLWRDSACDRAVDCLQVPSLTEEGSRLPLSALTNERQATFFYGQITVRVEHDVC